MPWFITKVDPALVVHCEDGTAIRFRHAEYRTSDPSELRALRTDPRVSEVIEQAAESFIRRYAINLETGLLHDLTRRRYHCHIPMTVLNAAQTEDEDPPAGWKLYRRDFDARRWNPGAEECAHCGQPGMARR